VNRGDQGPFLLAVAGTLLLLSVVAYAISDADAVAQRREAVRRNREALARQAQELCEGRKVLDAEMDRITKEQWDLSGRQEAILDALKRLEQTNKVPPANGIGISDAETKKSGR
jgi:hypothetical protein